MNKKLVITLIAIAVASLHFLIGEEYQGRFPAFVNGYLIDMLQRRGKKSLLWNQRRY